jgi:hypothetical protein
MNNENLIFVSYYPGCCGQFIGGLCDILLNNKGYPMLQKTGEVSRILQRTLIGLENELNTKYIEITCMPTWGDEHRSLFEKLMSEWMSEWNFRGMPGQSHYVITSHILAIKELQDKFNNNKIILSIPNDQTEMTHAWELWNIKKTRGQFPEPIYWQSSLDFLKEYVINEPNILVFNLYEILNEQNIDTNLNKIIKHLNLTDKYKSKAADFYKEYLKKQQIS